jgi:hypothetical protein
MDYWMSFSFHIFPDYYFKMSVVVAQQKINGRPNQFYGDGRHSFILKLPVLPRDRNIPTKGSCPETEFWACYHTAAAGS